MDELSVSVANTVIFIFIFIFYFFFHMLGCLILSRDAAMADTLP